MYWTRLISIDDYQVEQPRKFAMAPDIIDELQSIAELMPADPDLWKPRFEPGAFNDEHGPLEVEKYRLSPQEMIDFAS